MRDSDGYHKNTGAKRENGPPYDRISSVFGRQVLQDDAMSVLILHRSGYAPCKMSRSKLKEIDWLRGESNLVGQRESTLRMGCRGRFRADSWEYARNDSDMVAFLSFFFFPFSWIVLWESGRGGKEKKQWIAISPARVHQLTWLRFYKYAWEIQVQSHCANQCFCLHNNKSWKDEQRMPGHCQTRTRLWYWQRVFPLNARARDRLSDCKRGPRRKAFVHYIKILLSWIFETHWRVRRRDNMLWSYSYWTRQCIGLWHSKSRMSNHGRMQDLWNRTDQTG